MSVTIDDKNVFTKEMTGVFEAEVIECPDCGFRFSTEHEDNDNSGVYSCPCCHEADLVIENGRLKEAIEAFEKEYVYEYGWQIKNVEVNKRSQWHKGALRGFEHIKEIFDKYFK